MVNDIVVCHLTRCTPDSMVASAKIARFIAEMLDAPLVHTEDQLVDTEDLLTGLRLFILVNSPTGFAPEAMRRFSAEGLFYARHAVFANNDYKIKPPSQSKTWMRKRWSVHKGESSNYYGYSLWTTVPPAMRNRFPLDSYVNWNQLTYVPQPGRESHQGREPGLFYWGALRLGREYRLARCLATDLFPVTISTAPQSVVKFQQHVPQANYLPQLKPLHAGLMRYRATLYTQDEYSDRYYCSPANRWYEALSAGLAILIEQHSVNTFQQAGLTGWEPFVVSNAADIARLLPRAEEIAAQQRQLWHADYRATLVQQLREAHAKTL